MEDSQGADKPMQLMGTAEIGALFGVGPGRVRTWRERYNTPAADFVIGNGKQVVRGWLPDRAAEWRLWREQGQVSGQREPQELMGVAQIGTLFGVNAQTVTRWLIRYAETHPCPIADYAIGTSKPVPGWLCVREEDWRTWDRTRPGMAARERAEQQVQRLERQVAAMNKQLTQAKASLRKADDSKGY